MKMSTILLNLIIYTITVVQPIDESKLSKNVDKISEKTAGDGTQSFEEKDSPVILNKYNLLNTAEESNLKRDLLLKIRYLKESESVNDEFSEENSKHSSPATSKSIENHINSPEEHSNENSDSVFKSKSADSSNKYSEKVSKTRKMSDEKENERDYLENISSSVGDDVSEPKSVKTNKNSKKISEKIDYDYKNPNDESNFDLDNIDDISNTRRMTGHINSKNRKTHPSNKRVPHENNSPAQRERTYNPNFYNIQHINPIDFNTIAKYEENTMRKNRIIPIARGNINLREQNAENSGKSAELKNIDDFSTEKMSNAYPYTPLTTAKMSKKTTEQNNRHDSSITKLIQASDKTQKIEDLSGEKFSYFRQYRDFKPSIVIPQYGFYRLG